MRPGSSGRHHGISASSRPSGHNRPARLGPMNEPNGTPVAGPTILVVEDEAPIAAAIAARLRSENFIVEVAPDGAIAIETFRRLRPGLIVLDLMLPGLDGLEVCRRVQ